LTLLGRVFLFVVEECRGQFHWSAVSG
jgi:hypothetical protein